MRAMSAASSLARASGALLGIALVAGALLGRGTRPTGIVDWIADLCGGDRPMFASAVDANGASSRPATIVKPLSCEPLAHVPGKSVTTALVEFPPGAYTGPHRHPGSVNAFVVSGSIRSQMAGTPAKTYHAGEVWFEPSRALHLFAENASGTEPARLLATFVTDENCGPLVIPEAGPGQ